MARSQEAQQAEARRGKHVSVLRRPMWIATSLLGASVVAPGHRPTTAAIRVVDSSARVGQPGRLVIVGGNLKADNASVYRAILDGRLGSGPLCVFPTAGAAPETAMAGPVATFDQHGGAGTATGVLIAVNKPETARDPAVVDQIRHCSGFFFIGGVQSRVTAAFRPQGKSTPAYEALMQRWREGAVVSGSSAGAAIMSDPMIAGGTSATALARGVKRISYIGGDADDSTGGVTIAPGLGFFSAALADQHFLARGRFGRLLVALADLDQFDLAFGIDENTALVVDRDSLWAAGASEILVFDERSATRSGKSTIGITACMLGAGDRFDLRSRAMTFAADKAPVARIDVANFTAADSVFSPWKLLRNLDQLARSTQTSLSLPFAGGEIVWRKGPNFTAMATAGVSAQGTRAALGFSGMQVDLKR